MGATNDLRRAGGTESVGDAAASAEKLKALVERVVRVAQPGDGAATLLFTLGRITSSSRWLDGGLRVEITGDDVASTLEIYADSTNERVVSPTRLAVPVGEFLVALQDDPDIVGALRADVGERKVVLSTRSSGMRERVDPAAPPNQEPSVHTRTTVPRMLDPRRDPED
jgi:hypothetical protein